MTIVIYIVYSIFTRDILESKEERKNERFGNEEGCIGENLPHIHKRQESHSWNYFLGYILRNRIG